MLPDQEMVPMHDSVQEIILCTYLKLKILLNSYYFVLFFKEAGRVSVIPFTLSFTLLFKSFIVKYMSKDVYTQTSMHHCCIASKHIHKSARVLTHTSTYTDTSTCYTKYVYTCLHTISYTLFHKHRFQSLR